MSESFQPGEAGHPPDPIRPERAPGWFKLDSGCLPPLIVIILFGSAAAVWAYSNRQGPTPGSNIQAGADSDSGGGLELCGNGVVDFNEECDSSSYFCGPGEICEACECKIPIVPPTCGNGMFDPGEECEPPNYDFCEKEGGLDPDLPPSEAVDEVQLQLCNAVCQCEPKPAVLLCNYNGIVEPPEECDPADLDDPNVPDSDVCPANSSCVDCACVRFVTCGDGVVDEIAFEQCEAGDLSRCEPGWSCSDTCQCLQPLGCGDGIAQVEFGEQCDGNDLEQCSPGMTCSNDCLCVTEFVIPQCGNGVVEQGEQCDGSDVSLCDPGMVCSNDCLCVTPFPAQAGRLCGNGIVDSGEGCDPPGGVCADNSLCSDACQCDPEAGTYFAVYDCFKIGPESYQWDEVIIRGAEKEVIATHTGDWQPFCPGSAEEEPPSDGGDGGSNCRPGFIAGCP